MGVWTTKWLLQSRQSYLIAARQQFAALLRSPSASKFVAPFSNSSRGCTEGKVLAIRREETSVWERRAPLNPNHVQTLVSDGVKVRDYDV